MAVQQDTRGPYASTGSIIKVIEKHRQVGLQIMSLGRLQQIGITEALAPRTLQSLTFLGFYDDDGLVTPEFDALRHAQEHDFKPRLAALLREAYAPILEVLDPATATPLDVENAFRGHGYRPTGQLPRMVQLFMGLMIYAGVMPEDRRKASPSGSRPQGGRTSGGAGGKEDVAIDAGPGNAVRETRRETPPPARNNQGGGFTQTDRNTFVLLMPSGPEMTLMVKMDVMRTSIEDRNFIFKIVDELREFADRNEASGEEIAGGDGNEAEVTP